MNYSTPETGVSAALSCLLQTERALVLEALIHVDRQRVLSYKIHRTSFTRSALYPEEPKTADDLPYEEEIDLRLASMYSGNHLGNPAAVCFAFLFASGMRSIYNIVLLHVVTILALYANSESIILSGRGYLRCCTSVVAI